jgi:hypothetical protein
VADDLHQKLVIWINDAERGAVYDRYSVVPEESVRDGWHRAICRAHHACDWSTTGTDGVCDDVGYEHVAETHRSGPQAVEELQALAALRAVVVLHAPVEGLCGECWGSIANKPWPCSTIQAIARELGITEGSTDA